MGNRLIVAILYEKGITVVQEDVSDRFLICLNKDIHGDPSKCFGLSYDKVFNIIVNRLKSGIYNPAENDKELGLGPRKVISAMNTNCAFSG